MRVCIVIPAYEPGGEFVPYAQEVLAAGLGPVLVVDDGSGPAYAPVFAALAEMGCTVLTHEQNRGKGAALKTALRWYGAHEDGCAGIVTADCDGQHTVKDVRRVCEAMEACPGTLVLGCRDFGPGTPARSATGNRVTSAAMRVLYNIDLKDTQTGLRGIPNGMHRDLLEVRGERYEYELNMLIYAKQRSIPYTIVPIETVYFNNNEGSHYRTVADSARIIHQLGSGLVQYAMSAGLSVVVDVFVYCVLVKWLLLGLPLAPRLFFAAVIARTLSSVVNYTCNRRLPYVQNKKIGPTVAKYYCLWLAQLMLSFVGVWAACTGLHMDDMLAKLLVDALLAVASYQVQLRWVFSEKTPRPVLYGSGEAMDAKRTTAQGGFAQRNAAPDFARQTQKVGPVTGQRGFAAGEMEAEADKCRGFDAGDPARQSRAGSGKISVRGGEAMEAKRTTAQGGFAQRNAAPDFARQTQKVGPVTGQRGFAAGEMEAEADKCRGFDAGDPARQSRAGSGKISAPVGPVTGQRGFAAGEMEAEADKCPQHAAGREDGGRGAAL